MDFICENCLCVLLYCLPPKNIFATDNSHDMWSCRDYCCLFASVCVCDCARVIDKSPTRLNSYFPFCFIRSLDFMEWRNITFVQRNWCTLWRTEQRVIHLLNEDSLFIWFHLEGAVDTLILILFFFFFYNHNIYIGNLVFVHKYNTRQTIFTPKCECGLLLNSTPIFFFSFFLSFFFSFVRSFATIVRCFTWSFSISLGISFIHTTWCCCALPVVILQKKKNKKNPCTPHGVYQCTACTVNLNIHRGADCISMFMGFVWRS